MSTPPTIRAIAIGVKELCEAFDDSQNNCAENIHYHSLFFLTREKIAYESFSRIKYLFTVQIQFQNELYALLSMKTGIFIVKE